MKSPREVTTTAMSDEVFFSDVVGKIIMTDHDLRPALEVLKEYAKNDTPEGMVSFDFSMSATLLATMVSVYIKSKESGTT